MLYDVLFQRLLQYILVANVANRSNLDDVYMQMTLKFEEFSRNIQFNLSRKNTSHISQTHCLKRH